MAETRVVDRNGIPLRQLTDPEHLRALAHPRRVELVDLLAAEGPLTATACAERLGDSPASCSYHLRQLARYGMVEEAPGGTGRQRPWRWVPVGNSIELSGGAAQQEAATAFLSALDLRALAKLTDWRARAPDDAWRDVGGSSDWIVPVTEAELTALGEAIDTLLAPYLRRLMDGVRPEGSRMVDVFLALLPRTTREEATDDA